MKILFIPVCYNSYRSTKKLLECIESAYVKTTNLELTVILSDNSDKTNDSCLIENNYSFNYLIKKNSNVGYFPAFYKAISIVQKNLFEFDYVIISNVDLIVDEDFFKCLSCLTIADQVGVIAPSIISEKNNRDANPKILKRPTKSQISNMITICSYPILYSLYAQISPVRRYFLRKNSDLKKENFYAPHGALIIFTKKYFLSGASVNYPRFLFGEEGFVAEQLIKHNLTIRYEPSLVVRDKEHGSTSLLKSKFLAQEHYKSYVYFLENFIEEQKNE